MGEWGSDWRGGRGEWGGCVRGEPRSHMTPAAVSVRVVRISRLRWGAVLEGSAPGQAQPSGVGCATCISSAPPGILTVV